jgi:hypothetical protein
MVNQVRALLVVLLLAAPMPLPAFAAGQIYLRDGRIIDVETWWQEGATLYYERYGGAIGVLRDDVARIEGTSAPRRLPTSPAAPATSEPAPVPAPVDSRAPCEGKLATELDDVERELVALRKKIDQQRSEVARFSGGLVKALNESTLATMRGTESLLERRRVSLKEQISQCAVAKETAGGKSAP